MLHAFRVGKSQNKYPKVLKEISLDDLTNKRD